MIHAARRASPETVRLIAICSRPSSQRTADTSRFTVTYCRPSGTIAPQPQAYAGASRDPSWNADSASTTTSTRPRTTPRTKSHIPRDPSVVLSDRVSDGTTEAVVPGLARRVRGQRSAGSTEGAEPGSGRPADSAMNHTAAPPITAAAIM